MKPTIDILIPSFNNDHLLSRCLISIISYTSAYFKVFVINNGDTQVERLVISKLFNYHKAEKNLGWAGGINFGSKLGTGKYILMLNDDTQIIPRDMGWLSRMVYFMETHPNTGVVVPMSNCVMHMQNFAFYNLAYAFNVSFCSNFCTLIRRDLFEKLGGLDETLYGGDDIDMSIRVRDLGYKITVMNNVFVFHQGYQTGTRLFGSEWNSDDYSKKVSLDLIKKHGFKKWLTTVLSGAIEIETGDEEGTDYETDYIKPIFDRTKKILDVGCGNRKIFPEATGVDLTLAGQEGYAGSQLNQKSVADINSDMCDMPMVENGSYDYVLSRHTLEHVINVFKALREWKRVLKVGGRLVIAVPDDEVLAGVPLDPSHIHGFTKDSLQEYVNAVGGLKCISSVTPEHCYSFVSVFEKTGEGQ